MIGAEDRVIAARWIVTSDGPPIERGTLTIRGGHIVAIHSNGDRSPDEFFDQAIITPGFVNAHTHLDLSHLHGRTPPTLPLTHWLKQIINGRIANDCTPQEAITLGLRQSLQHGTTLIADIAGSGLSWGALATAKTWAVCFREILGLKSSRADAAWKEAISWLQSRPDEPTVQAALSPHAPYSTNRAIIEAASRIAPVCIHLAESAHEAILLDQHAGPFVEFMQQLGVWEPSSLAPNWDWIAWRCSRAAYALFAHGNFLPPGFHLPPNGTVVYCPRTHAAFQHGDYPLRRFLSEGKRIALGTDSLASNPDLDILAEARFVRQQFPELLPATIIKMATINGAEAVQLDQMTGSIQVGKSADLVVVPVSNVETNDPLTLLLDQPLPNEPRRTMWRGEWR